MSSQKQMMVLVIAYCALLPGCGDGPFKDGTTGELDAGISPAGDGAARPTGDHRVTPSPAVDMAPLPENCPCPLDAYCDLSTNSCVVGCKSNDHCNQGKYCDSASGLCQPGCRTKADCPDDTNPCTDLICQSGSCKQVPNSASCPDDGKSCTADVCSNGACTHPPANDGKLCGQTLACSDFRCSGGACVETPFKQGTSCPDDGDGCTSDSCDGLGSCGHATLPDGSECPNTWGGWNAKCFKGKCYPKRYQCCSSSLTYLNFTTGKTENWTGTTSCGCSSGTKDTMKWSGWYSGYFLNHSEYCSGACLSPSGAYCQDCYDLP